MCVPSQSKKQLSYIVKICLTLSHVQIAPYEVLERSSDVAIEFRAGGICWNRRVTFVTLFNFLPTFMNKTPKY